MNQFSKEIHLDKLQIFERDVILKYQIFNGLFLGLPFADPDQAGPRVPIFTKMCTDWLEEGFSVPQAVEKYLSIVPLDKARHPGLLFKFLQFIERQVVLFDSLEDAAFSDINDMSGYGTIDYLLGQVHGDKLKYCHQLRELLTNYKTRIVLTAHPTQFYPKVILDIINNLDIAIKENDINEIRNLFLQMGLTKFANKVKPTPIDEAQSIIWYLENIFYQVVPEIQAKLGYEMTNLDIGFWPGGDRDGNPFVTSTVTLQAAQELRQSLLRLYYADILLLHKRLTFEKVQDKIGGIAIKIEQDNYTSAQDLIKDLLAIKEIIDLDYQGLFADLVQKVILKVKLFSFYFAKLDIRQNSAIHKQVITIIFREHKLTENYAMLDEAEKLKLLEANWGNAKLLEIPADEELALEVLNTIRVIHTVQRQNGMEAIERYIISNTDSAASVFEVLWLVALVNATLKDNEKIKIEIVPLFETIDDLHNSEAIMETLYNLPLFAENVERMGKHQTIMLGFSDGTKDGGYLMANWAIFQAKKRLCKLAKLYTVNVTFFDGRGGPPSRGGGDTYAFYQSLAREIEAHEIQLTIQGQTISANFGTPDAAMFNLEHLLSAGISGQLFADRNDVLSEEDEALITNLAKMALAVYLELRDDPLFVPYLEEITPLHYLAEINIGSRPAKRNSDNQLKLADLRAIPFGAAWMLLKQNILGYYGLGTAISEMIAKDKSYEAEDNLIKLKHLYQESLLFKGLMDNAMQSLVNVNFVVTRHLKDDPKFGGFWQKIYDEAELSRKMLLLISGHQELIPDKPIKIQSIKFREQIIFPLILIQQYAMDKLRHMAEGDPNRSAFEHIVKKSLAASINASRNSI